MAQPDFEGARAYVLERLAVELSPTMFYHSLAHTKDDVAPAVERLALIEGITGDELLLLKTAAYYHDIGYIEKSQDHETVSIEIAEQILPRFGYNHEQIQAIKGLIGATRLPQSPHSKMEQIMADADLDVLGRGDYMSRSQALREELAANGSSMSDLEWFTSQLKFLHDHQYFTQAAKNLRNPKKQQNAVELLELLAQYQSH
jgi:uncharacterized protein